MMSSAPYKSSWHVTLTPTEFEQEVTKSLHEAGTGLADFQVVHRDILAGVDGEYEMDATARFTALEADLLVPIECKHQRRPVGRAVVQVLLDKVRSTGAHKGMLFSTGGFQRGALKYAGCHGIALVDVKDGRSTYHTRSTSPVVSYPTDLPKHVCVLRYPTGPDPETFCVLGETGIGPLRDAFEPKSLDRPGPSD